MATPEQIADFYNLYPMIDTKPSEILNFLGGPGWRAIEQMLEADKLMGMSELLDPSNEDMGAVNVLRGRILAYEELRNLRENLEELLREENEDDNTEG